MFGRVQPVEASSPKGSETDDWMAVTFRKSDDRILASNTQVPENHIHVHSVTHDREKIHVLSRYLE